MTYSARSGSFERHGDSRSPSVARECAVDGAASVRSRGLVRIRLEPDGDWRHRWDGDHFLFSAVPWSNPAKHVDYQHPAPLRHYLPKRGGVVVDCGAGVGTEVRVFADLVGPTGRFLAIEPYPIAFHRLSKLVNRLPVASVDAV